MSPGTCYIQISLMEGRQFELENWDYLWGRANKIREQCVQGLGVGGSANSGKSIHLFIQPSKLPIQQPRLISLQATFASTSKAPSPSTQNYSR